MKPPTPYETSSPLRPPSTQEKHASRPSQVWLRLRPEAEKPVKIIEPSPEVDKIAELTRILEETGEPVSEPVSGKKPLPLRRRSARTRRRR